MEINKEIISQVPRAGKDKDRKPSKSERKRAGGGGSSGGSRQGNAGQEEDGEGSFGRR